MAPEEVAAARRAARRDAQAIQVGVEDEAHGDCARCRPADPRPQAADGAAAEAGMTAQRPVQPQTSQKPAPKSSGRTRAKRAIVLMRRRATSSSSGFLCCLTAS